MPGYCFAVAGQTATCLGRNGENLYVTQNEASSDTNRRMPMARPITQVEAEGTPSSRTQWPRFPVSSCSTRPGTSTADGALVTQDVLFSGACRPS